VNAALDNAAFIASLTPDLREEVLLTAEPAFLASLPAEMAQEAEQLRERRMNPRMMANRIPGTTFELEDDDEDDGEDDDDLMEEAMDDNPFRRGGMGMGMFRGGRMGLGLGGEMHRRHRH